MTLEHAILWEFSRRRDECYDMTIRIWDAKNSFVVGEPLEGYTRSVRPAASSSDGRHIISGSSDRAIPLWDPTLHIPMQFTISAIQTGRPDLEGWVRDSVGRLLY